jgi:predicted AlkP superfamily phosphohydrolase/phosphomutase/tetratricopeptide (TPR) repeat protein
MAKKLANKILVIGWDAAEWSIIEPLIQQGKMPALQRLMSEGVYGRLKTLDPPLSPMLWTSIATGVRADKHGVCGFVEPIPTGEGLRPVTSTSRKVKAIWNMFTQENLKSNVVAWWPSNPVEQINGVMVSNLYQVATKAAREDWKMSDGTIHPKEKEEEMMEFRVHPHEITLNMVAPFVPNIVEDIELRKDKRVASVIKIIANAASVHAASTHLMENTEWDFMAVYHDAIDHFCHTAMRYHPPLRKHIDEKEFDNFQHVVEAGYQFHDMMLERTLELIDDQTTVILLSDHGFYSDHRRPLQIPKEPSGPAAEHSPYGVIVMKGPGIKNTGEEITGASVIDITPTILALSGLPIGNDMEGKALTYAFSEDIQPEFIPSWEEKEGFSGMHDKNVIEDPWAAQEALQQLVELGYIEAMDDNKLEQVAKAKLESDYYVARNMIDGGRLKEAIPILERIFAESSVIRYGQRLAFAYLSLKRYDKVAEVIARLKEVEKTDLEDLKKKAQEKNPKDPFLNKEFEEPNYLDFIEGLMLLALNKPGKALPLLEKVQQKNPNSLDVALNIAKIHKLRKSYSKAEKQYIKALAIDERNAAAHHGLGICLLRQNKYDIAIDEFLSALESNFYMPSVHYHLGEALYKVGDFSEAAEAFEVAIHLAPGMTKAHKWLFEIYTDKLNDTEKASKQKEFLDNNIKGEIVVVTGLPKTGSSLMMEMLQVGGMPILVDDIETNDKSPKKTMEFAKVNLIQKDISWMVDARGKAVKMIVQLLNYLPPNYNYKVIQMNRDISELMMSQQVHLGKKATPETLPLKLFNNYLSQLSKLNTWVEAQPNVQVLKVEFDDLIENPIEQAEIIADFLGEELDFNSMAKVINPELIKIKKK